MTVFDAVGKQIKVGDEVAVLMPEPGAMVGKVTEIVSEQTIMVKRRYEITPRGTRALRFHQLALTNGTLVLK